MIYNTTLGTKLTIEPSICSQVTPILLQTLIPTRTNNLRNFAQDLFLPTFVNHALKLQNVVAKIFVILSALILDMLTFPIRLLTCMPKVLSNACQKQKPKVLTGSDSDRDQKVVKADLVPKSVVVPVDIPVKVEKPVADVFIKHGFTYLTHFTRWEKLPSILKTGYLFTGDKVPFKSSGGSIGGNQPNRVFFDATKFTHCPNSIAFHSSSYSSFNGQQSGDLAHVTLIFELNVLKNAKFHVSSSGYIMRGDFSKNDYRHDMTLEKLNEQLKKSKDGCGELVVYENVSTKSLAGLWVHPSRKQEMVNFLKDNSIATINDTPVEEFVNKE